MPCSNHPSQNHLLRLLPADVKERLFSQLEFVTLPLGHVVYESGFALEHVYFPTDSIISLLYVMEDGASAEIAVVGKAAHADSAHARERCLGRSSERGDDNLRR